MAQLPSGRTLIQQIDGSLVMFERYTEHELLRVDPGDGDAMAKAQRRIYFLEQDGVLTSEDRCFAHFWFGYFYAHASMARAGQEFIL